MPTTQAQDEHPLPIQVEHESRNRTGTEPDQARIEELLHQGLRPKDARRIERLERELDLPEEQRELDRVRAAAVLRADPEMRRDVIAEIVRQALHDEITDYEALCRLQDLEIVPDECDFARYAERTTRDLFVCYRNGTPQVAFAYYRPAWPDGDPDASEIDASEASALPE